jgi:mycothiol system anti-sigma-R factor
MRCEDVRRFAQVYLDGEFDENDRRAMETHLKECPQCQHQVEYERRFQAAIRARVPRVRAPEELRERLQEKLLRPQGRRWPYRQVLLWSSVPAAGVLVLMLSITWTVTSAFSPRLLEEAVDRHSQQAPVEVATENLGDVEEWFRSKVNFHVALPPFSDREFRVVGARLSHLAERQAAQVRYRQGGRNYSLFVFSDPGGPLELQRCHRLGKRKLCLEEKRGYTVVVWRSRGLAYSLVGDLPAGQMLDVMNALFRP